MRRRSIVGPALLVLIGVLFLLYNLRPDLRILDLVATYWPLLLIAWGLLRLAEVVTAFAQGRAVACPIFSGGEVALIVFICLIGSGIFMAHRSGPFMRFGPFNRGGLEVFGELHDYPVAGEAPAAGVKRIVFDSRRGNLRITGGDAQAIKVTGRKSIRTYTRGDADDADRQSPLEISTEGDRAVIRINQEKVTGNRRVSTDLEVTVPRSVSIEARGTYGDFDISDVSGSVDISSGNAGVRISKIGGDAKMDLGRSDIIRAVDVKGNIQLLGRGADIELENISGQVTVSGSYGGKLQFKNLAKPLHFESRMTDLRVEAVPGEISIDLSDLTGNNLVGPVRLSSKSRDIRLADFTQPVEIDVERGDIELSPGRAPLAGIDARSRAGNIVLALPDDARFELDARTERGEARNDFGPSIQSSSDGRSASLKGGVGKGPMIRLTTERGTVTVRKGTAAAARQQLRTETF